MWRSCCWCSVVPSPCMGGLVTFCLMTVLEGSLQGSKARSYKAKWFPLVLWDPHSWSSELHTRSVSSLRCYAVKTPGHMNRWHGRALTSEPISAQPLVTPVQAAACGLSDSSCWPFTSSPWRPSWDRWKTGLCTFPNHKIPEDNTTGYGCGPQSWGHFVT